MNAYFQSPPQITLATNMFINIPVILKYDETPLIEIVHEENLGFTVQIHLYHSDGAYLGKVTGNRLRLNCEDKQMNIDINDTPEKITCRLENKVVFQLSRVTAESFNMECELFAPSGHTVKCSGWSKPELFDPKGDVVPVGGVLVSGCVFKNSPVGIWLKQNGSCILG